MNHACLSGTMESVAIVKNLPSCRHRGQEVVNSERVRRPVVQLPPYCPGPQVSASDLTFSPSPVSTGPGLHLPGGYAPTALGFK